jgi:GNAT superfamily N-acetyltransferase
VRLLSSSEEGDLTALSERLGHLFWHPPNPLVIQDSDVDTTCRIRRTSFDDPLVQRLVAEIQQEFVVRYGGPDRTPVSPSHFAPPHGAFLLALSGEPEEPVGMGGWRFRPDVAPLGGSTAAEVKRMYVVPAARGRGWARLLLGALESSARGAGADVMILETGTAQPEAIALYQSSGYVAVERFGYYRDSPTARYFGKRL